MPYLMQAVELAAVPPGIVEPPTGFLKSFDPDANGGWGLITWTTDPEDAMVFATVGDALEMWKRQSTLLPLRPDGRPNRPLTAWTVTFWNVGDLPFEAMHKANSSW
jgi:hypothetical protein